MAHKVHRTDCDCDRLDARPTPQVVGREVAGQEVRRARCGSTVYFGSRADWRPASNTAKRSRAAPAATSRPPATAAKRRLRAAVAMSTAPTPEHALAALSSAPARPCL